MVFESQDLWPYTESSAEDSMRKFVGEALPVSLIMLAELAKGARVITCSN